MVKEEWCISGCGLGEVNIYIYIYMSEICVDMEWNRLDVYVGFCRLEDDGGVLGFVLDHLIFFFYVFVLFEGW